MRNRIQTTLEKSLSPNSFIVTDSNNDASYKDTSTVKTILDVQPKIQFRKDGVNLGGFGEISVIDFTGAGVVVSKVNNIATVNISSTGGGGSIDLGYTSSTTIGTITNTGGTNAVIPAATTLASGLLTAADKTKLDGISSNAEQNVNADWNAVSGDALILNKPTIPSIAGLATTSYVDSQDALKQDLLVSGTNIKTINGTSLLGSGDITISGGSGEVNTASNVGTGEGVFKQKSGVNLEFKSLLAGTGITVTNNANDLTIATTITQYTDGLAQAAVVIDSIADSDTTHAPSRNAVFDALSTKQPLDADLTAIAALSGTNGFLKTDGAGVWSVDTATYLTANQNISLSGQATGSGTTSISVTLDNAAVINKVLTGFTSTTGTILATDSILQAIQKLDGNLASATAGGVSSVTGTTNRITATAGSNPIIDISASYVGQTSITTLGTITTGAYQATAIADAYIASASTWNAKQTAYANLTSIGSLADSAGVLTNNGSGTFSYTTITSNATHTGDATGATALTVVGINGTLLSGLATGILKNTTGTGVPSIAVAGDFPTLNQNTTGSAATLTTGRTISITGDLAYTSPSFDGSGNVTAAGTLATVNSNVGSFGSSTQVGTFTVNAKGLITAASNVTITPAASNITGGAALTKVDDTNVTLTLGGTPTTALLAGVSLTLGWSGTLADGRIASASNWNTAYTNRITTLTTTGSSGAATLTSNVLNIPNYTLAGLGGQPQLSGTGFVKISGTTISYDNNTYLTGNESISLTGEATGTGATSISVTLSNSAVIGKVLTGFTSSTGTILATDSILQAIQKLDGNLAAATAGGVSSVSGTTNRITSTGGSNPIIDISASYVGQTSITTLGTVTIGTYQATPIGDTYISSATTWNNKQAGIQFQDEGSNLGTSNTVTGINFTGGAITASRVGNIVTVDVPLTAGVTNLDYTTSATNGVVTSDTGNDATILAASGTIAGLMLPADFTKLSYITITQAVDLDALESDVADLTTLSGVASNSTTLGTFTGTTIPDNSTNKAALQSLETALEERQEKKIRTVTSNPTISATTDGTVVLKSTATVAALPSVVHGVILRIKNLTGGNISVTGHLDEVASSSYTLPNLETLIVHGEGVLNTWIII